MFFTLYTLIGQNLKRQRWPNNHRESCTAFSRDRWSSVSDCCLVTQTRPNVWAYLWEEFQNGLKTFRTWAVKLFWQITLSLSSTNFFSWPSYAFRLFINIPNKTALPPLCPNRSCHHNTRSVNRRFLLDFIQVNQQCTLLVATFIVFCR